MVSFIKHVPTAPALVLFDTFAKVINVSSDCKLANGLLWTNSAPALALSLDVPLCSAVCNHLASDGLRFCKLDSSASKQLRAVLASSLISTSFMSNNSPPVLNLKNCNNKANINVY